MSAKDFVIENGVLISYKGSDESVEIPAEVEKIGVGAFKNNRKIKEVVFACKNLKSIEEDAFYDCTSLEGIKIPEGTVQIARRAFMGCTNMEYIYIPSSVMIIGDIVTESSVSVFGVTGSEAEKYAKKRLARFKTDLSNSLKLINSKKLEKENVTYQTFSVFGEEITVSSSLKRYHKILEYYNRRQEEFFDEMMTAVPKDYTFSKKVANGEPIFMGEREKTVKRLEKSGIYISEGELNSYTYDSMKLISDLFGLILKAYTELHSSALSDMKNQVQRFYDQAESHVTGLSYGHIGGGVGLVAYAFDDFLAKQKQRKRAYAVAEQQKTTYVNEQTAELNRTYGEFYNRFVPLYKKATDAHIEALLKCELEYNIKHGLIDADTKGKYDIAKSSELMQDLYEKGSSNAEYVIALALKLYPMNISAHVYALEKELVCDGLEQLRAFLELNASLQPHKDRVRHEKYEEVSAKIISKSRAVDGVKLIKENTFLSRDEIKIILTRYSTNLTGSVKKIIDDNLSGNYDTRVYFHQKLSNIVDKETWGFFDEYGVAPIKSSDIPKEAQQSFEKLVEYLEMANSGRQNEKDEQLNRAQELLNKAETFQDFDEVIDSLSKISGYKNAKELCTQAKNKRQSLAQKTIDKLKNEISSAQTIDELNSIEQKIDSVKKHISSNSILFKNCTSLFTEKKNEIKQNTKKRNKTLAVIGSVAVVVLAVVLFVSVETAPKRNFKKMLENDAVVAENIDYELKYDLLHGNSKDLQRAIVEKLNEYYKNNDVESAVNLIWEISYFMDSSIIDGWDVRASAEFTNWIFENYDNNSNDIKIRKRSYAGGGLWVYDVENEYAIYNSNGVLGTNSDSLVVG